MTHLRSVRVVVQDYKRVPARAGIGFTSEKDGQSEIVCQVELDERALLTLVEKAGRNRGGRSQCGPVHVRVLTRRKVVE